MSSTPISAPLVAMLLTVPLVMVAGLPRGAAAPRRLAEVVVDAGEFDRQNSVVIFPLPEELQGLSLLLRDRRGGQHLVQVDDRGRAVFILKGLERGRSEPFSLELRDGRKPRGGVELRREADGVRLLIGGKPALRYQTTGKQPSPTVAPDYVRGGYLHPVFTPAGVMVTDDYPSDHRHHHGIWAAWTETEFEGRKPDFWNMGKKIGRVDFHSLDATWDGPVFGGLRARHVYTDLQTPEKKTALNDDWLLMVYRTHPEGPSPYYLFDLESVQTAPGAPLTVAQYRYGGIGMRGHADWNGKGNATFLTSEGKGRLDGNATTGRWCHMGGKTKVKGGRESSAGITILGHPGNFRAPQPMRLNPDNPFFNFAPSQAGTFTIKPGTPFVARHRFVVADGPADPKLLERLWNDYAYPPQVTLNKK
jgi:hypothetical protein